MPKASYDCALTRSLGCEDTTLTVVHTPFGQRQSHWSAESGNSISSFYSLSHFNGKFQRGETLQTLPKWRRHCISEALKHPCHGLGCRYRAGGNPRTRSTRRDPNPTRHTISKFLCLGPFFEISKNQGKSTDEIRKELKQLNGVLEIFFHGLNLGRYNRTSPAGCLTSHPAISTCKRSRREIWPF